MGTAEREKREWWAYFEGNVIRVTGYSCAPAHPESWWCQQVGHTLTEGYQLFAREDEALRLAIRETDRELRELGGKITGLRGRLQDQDAADLDLTAAQAAELARLREEGPPAWVRELRGNIAAEQEAGERLFSATLAYGAARAARLNAGFMAPFEPQTAALDALHAAYAAYAGAGGTDGR